MRWLLVAMVALGCAKEEQRLPSGAASASASAGAWAFPFSAPRPSAAPPDAGVEEEEREYNRWRVAGATIARWDGPRIVVFRVGKSAVVTIDEPARRPFESVDLSPAGDEIQTRSADQAQLWDPDSGQMIQPRSDGDETDGVMVDDTRRYRAVTASSVGHPFEAATVVWSLEPAKKLWRKELFTAGEFAPGGEHLTGRREGMSQEDMVGVFRTKDGSTVAGWEPPWSACASGSDWSDDGKRYAKIDDERIHAVDVPSRQHRAFKVLEGEACGLNLIDMTPDGRYFASPYRLFAFEPMREYGRFARDCATCEVMSERPVSFSPDGRFLGVLWNGPPIETAVFRVEPFDPKPLFTFPGDAVWLAGTSVMAATQRADRPTLLLVRVPDGARFVLDARKPDLEALRAFIAPVQP